MKNYKGFLCVALFAYLLAESGSALLEEHWFYNNSRDVPRIDYTLNSPMFNLSCIAVTGSQYGDVLKTYFHS